MLGGIFMPGDGQADPIGVTNLLAKAAKKEVKPKKPKGLKKSKRAD